MESVSREPEYQAYILLKIVFVALPLITGLDKFFDFLVDWRQYLEPALGGSGEGFVYLVGIVEIMIALGVLVFPRIFANIAALWMALIIVNLMTLANSEELSSRRTGFFFFLHGAYYDVALRDFGLFLSALALGRLAKKYS